MIFRIKKIFKIKLIHPVNLSNPKNHGSDKKKNNEHKNKAKRYNRLRSSLFGIEDFANIKTENRFIRIFSPHQLNHLHIPNFRAGNHKAHKCPHGVEAVFACRARIDVQHLQTLVVLNFQDVRMPADKQFGGIGVKFLANFRRIFPRIASYMCQ